MCQHRHAVSIPLGCGRWASAAIPTQLAADAARPEGEVGPVPVAFTRPFATVATVHMDLTLVSGGAGQPSHNAPA